MRDAALSMVRRNSPGVRLSYIALETVEDSVLMKTRNSQSSSFAAASSFGMICFLGVAVVRLCHPRPTARLEWTLRRCQLALAEAEHFRI